jgi:hypothetical protein
MAINLLRSALRAWPNAAAFALKTDRFVDYISRRARLVFRPADSPSQLQECLIQIFSTQLFRVQKCRFSEQALSGAKGADLMPSLGYIVAVERT